MVQHRPLPHPPLRKHVHARWHYSVIQVLV